MVVVIDVHAETKAVVVHQMELRAVQEREGGAIRRHGDAGGSPGERRIHQDGRPVRPRPRRHQQQQLRQHPGERKILVIVSPMLLLYLCFTYVLPMLLLFCPYNFVRIILNSFQ